ncbi:MAG: hypothetical protein ACI9FU_000155 [Granulosicoccus sp.]|jgi:hypothetical protein
MKNISLTLLVLASFGFTASAHHYPVVNGYGNSFVFNEDGITFSVYPDGEFDFYIEPVINSVCVNTPVGGFSFNSGYDYSPYLQYDDYGAVIQVENVPVYYDYYGRVSQIGDVAVNYRNRRVCQVGGLYAYYNSYGHFTHHSGFINMWNPYYVHQSHYSYFARPVVNLCLVNLNPYRTHYRPIRHVYYRPYAPRVRPHYASIGHTYSPSGRVVSSHYRQPASRNETAYHRGHRKVTKESVRKTTASRNVNSARTGNRVNNSAGKRPTSTRPVTTTSRPNRGAATNATANNRGGTKAPSNVRNGSNSGRVKSGMTANRAKPATVNSRPTSRNTQSSSASRNNGVRKSPSTRTNTASPQTRTNRVASSNNGGSSRGSQAANRSSSRSGVSKAKSGSGANRSKSTRSSNSRTRK